MMDLIIPSTLNDLKEIAFAAENFNCNALIVAREFKNLKELSEWSKEIDLLEKQSKINFKICSLFTKELSQLLQSRTDISAVLSDNISFNKKAVDDNKIRLLLRFTSSKKLCFDKGIARIAGEKKKILGVLFSDLLKASFSEKTGLLNNYCFISKLLRKFQVPLIVFSGASSVNELRSMNDLKYLMQFFGFTLMQSIFFQKNASQLLFGD